MSRVPERWRIGGRNSDRLLQGLLLLGLLGCDSGTKSPPPSGGNANGNPKGAATTGAPAEAKPWFVDRAAEAGFDFTHSFGDERRFQLPETVTGGVALFDFDGDGDLGIYCVQGGDLLANASGAPKERGNRLYRNDREFRFVDVTSEAGVGDRGYGIGAAVGDFDRDGDPDLYVTNVGANVLYRNDGDGTFTDVTEAAGVGDASFGSSATFGDLDGDGAPELFIANYIRWSPETEIECESGAGRRDYCAPKNYQAPAPDTLYRNRGDGTFEDVSQSSGCRSIFGNGLGVVFADLDGDGRRDIYVANDGNPNQLWRQVSPLRFEDVAPGQGAAVDMNGVAEAGMGISVLDLDDDGDLDLFLTHLRGETNTFYRNDGLSFTDATVLTGLAGASRDFTGFGVVFGDFDHDGRSDLYVGNGRVMGSGSRYTDDIYAEPNQLFRGVGPSQFSEVQPRGGTDPLLAHCSRGVASGDLDDDGDLDLVVINSGGRAYLLENVAPKLGGSLTVTLRDAQGREVLGALLKITLDHGTAPPRTMIRLADRGGSFASSHDPRVHIGLGSAKVVSEVIVTWPDGVREQFGPFASGGRPTVRYGTGTRLR